MTVKMVTRVFSSVCLLLMVMLLKSYQDRHQASIFIDEQPRSEVTALLLTPHVQAVSADIHHYSAITRHPLFNPSRTPYTGKKEMPISKPVPIVTPQPTIKPDSPSLVGVMTVNDVKMAFVIAKEDTEPAGLKIGESYQGWTLTAIEPAQVIMHYNETEKTIGMDWTLKEMLYDSVDNTEQQSLTQFERTPGNQPKPVIAPISLKARLARQIQTNR
jgi:type II secretory pathway component PulC